MSWSRGARTQGTRANQQVSPTPFGHSVRGPRARERLTRVGAVRGGVVVVVVAAVVAVLAKAFGFVVSRTDSRETVENAHSLENSYQDGAKIAFHKSSTKRFLKHLLQTYMCINSMSSGLAPI